MEDTSTARKVAVVGVFASAVLAVCQFCPPATGQSGVCEFATIIIESYFEYWPYY